MEVNRTAEVYGRIAKSEAFRQLLAQKKRFILSMSLFFLVFYFALPVLSSYTDLLNRSAIGPVTWAWVFAFAQFVMTWTLCWLYTRKAVKFDETAELIKRNAIAHIEEEV